MGLRLKWKIRYGDGSTFSDADGSPYDAPRLDVQVIVGADKLTGRYIVSDKDAYWWDTRLERWLGGDRRGEWDYLVSHPGPCVVLYGRAIGDDAYNACMAAALTDSDFPPKTARGRGESLDG